MLAACQCDRDDLREVTREEAQVLAISHGARYRETSALTGRGVDEALEGLAAAVLARERDGWRPEEFREQPAAAASVRMRPLSGR